MLLKAIILDTLHFIEQPLRIEELRSAAQKARESIKDYCPTDREGLLVDLFFNDKNAILDQVKSSKWLSRWLRDQSPQQYKPSVSGIPKCLSGSGEVNLRYENITCLPTNEPLHNAFMQCICAGSNRSWRNDQRYKKRKAKSFSVISKNHQIDKSEDATDDSQTGKSEETEEPYVHSALQMLMRRIMIATLTHGFIGLGPEAAKPGDVAILPQGWHIPLMLRPEPERSSYRFIGECYLHGIMHGEWFRKQQATFHFQEISIL